MDDLIGQGFLLVVILGLIWYLFIRDTKPKPSPWTRGTGSTASNGAKSTASSMQSQSLADKLKKEGKNMIIFYGSQTGTAEDFSHRLTQDGKQWGFNAHVMDFEDFENEELAEIPSDVAAVFCVATYGEGEPTDNAVTFHEWLDEVDDEELLTNLKFTVFGLGNTTYEHYQYMGKKVDERLLALGGECIFPRGEGDEDTNMEDDFAQWQEEMWPTLNEYFHLEATGAQEAPTKQFVWTPVDEMDLRDAEHKRMLRMKKSGLHDAKLPFLAEVVANRELMKDGSGRSCRHVEVNIKGSGMRYEAGDHLGVMPSNDSGLVEALAERLGVNLDDAFSVKADAGISKKPPFPSPSSLRTILTNYTDIIDPVSKFVLKGIAQYASDESEREDIMALVSRDNKARYNKWVKEDERNILDVLQHYTSLNPPADHLIELLPRLQPRFYSISSSPKQKKEHIHITAVLIDWVTPGTKRQRKGVATHWLNDLRPDGGPAPVVPCWVRRSTFRLPKFTHVPVIMVGPGTGIAPFRGFLQDRAADFKKGKAIGDTVLFFGARTHDEFLYEEELLEATRSGTVLTQLHLAFSREQEKKIYVQDKVREQADDVWRLLKEENAHFYICGDAKHMSKDVQSVLLEIVKDKEGLNDADAKAWMTNFTSSKRFQQDVW